MISPMMISPDGVVPIRTVGVSVSVIFPCTIKSRRFLLAPAHPKSRKKGHKIVVCVCVCVHVLGTQQHVYYFLFKLTEITFIVCHQAYSECNASILTKFFFFGGGEHSTHFLGNLY